MEVQTNGTGTALVLVPREKSLSQGKTLHLEQPWAHPESHAEWDRVGSS